MKGGQRFFNVINNVEEISVRKTFSGFLACRLLVTCGEFSFNGDYESHVKKEENSKIIYCPECHIKNKK